MVTTVQEFIDVWMEAYNNDHSIAWIAKKLAISNDAVQKRSNLMKQRGIELPPITNSKNWYTPEQVAKLNDRIAHYTAPTTPSEDDTFVTTDTLKVPILDFINAYMEAEQYGHTNKWIAKRLGLSLTAVSMRASYLRRAGVALPRKNTGRINNPNLLKQLRAKVDFIIATSDKTHNKTKEEKFIDVYMEAYQNDKNHLWVANKLNIHRSYVSNYKRKLKNMGIPLPELRPAFDFESYVPKLKEKVESLTDSEKEARQALIDAGEVVEGYYPMVTDQVFLAIWQEAADKGYDREWIADKTKYTVGTVSVRMSKLRKSGIDCPPFVRTYNRS